MATLLTEALKGAHAELLEANGPLERLRRIGALTGILAGEVVHAASLTPLGLRAARVRRCISRAGSPGAAAGGAPYGVVLHAGLRYGAAPRQLVDIYVPAALHAALLEQRGQNKAEEQNQAPTQLPLAPVAVFVHGGIWVTGERWHFGALATRLAQAGLVVAVPSYTLYPRAVALAMAGEVAEALLWISAHADSFGGDAAAVSVLGHSAGAHLGALALLSLAQAHEESAAAAAQQGSNLERRHTASSSLARAPTRSSSSSSSTTTINDNNTCAPRHDDTTATALHAAGSPPPPLLPKLFVGMCGIYDVAAHRCHEAARGVAGVSTMSRAVGGAALFDAVSPTKLLRRAAQHAPRSSSGSSSTTAAAEGPRQQQRLPGAVAPHDTHHPMGAWLQAAQPLDAAPLLSRFAAGAPSGAAARLPPLLLMSSSGDHMVPPREAAAMAAAAAAAGARPHHLVYSRPRHNDFALDWVPLRSCCAAGATQSSNCGSNSGSDTGCGKLCSCRSASCSDTSRGQLLPWAVRLLLPRGGEQLPGFATDLLAMLTWQRGGKAAPAAGTSCSSCTGGLTPMLLGPQEGPAPFLPRARL